MEFSKMKGGVIDRVPIDLSGTSIAQPDKFIKQSFLYNMSGELAPVCNFTRTDCTVAYNCVFDLNILRINAAFTLGHVVHDSHNLRES